MGIKYPLPNIEGTEYIIYHLNQLGWVGNGAMGAIPLSFTEIDAYNRATYSFLNADEVLLIRKMSSAYVSEINDKSPNKKAPYKEVTTD